MQVPCPQCGQPAEFSPQNPYRPFCCERCKLIDLGAWANNEYIIEGQPGSAMELSPEELAAATEQAQKLNKM